MPELAHWQWDLIFWAAFVGGQMMFLLKRADLARRSPMNGVKSIGQFFAQNWVVILTRMVFESTLLYVYRHPDFPMEVGLHFSLPAIKQSVVLSFFGGFFSDASLDWITGQNTIMGIPIPSWIKEQIPQLPQVQQFVNTLAAKTNGKETE